MLSKQQLGTIGELKARRFLESHGYRFVMANYRTRSGEIDLVMRDGETLVFVEVKARRGVGQGVPQEAVTCHKLRHMLATARIYLAAYRYTGNWRFDVVAVTGDDVRHIRNVTM